MEGNTIAIGENATPAPEPGPSKTTVTKVPRKTKSSSSKSATISTDAPKKPQETPVPTAVVDSSRRVSFVTPDAPSNSDGGMANPTDKIQEPQTAPDTVPDGPKMAPVFTAPPVMQGILTAEQIESGQSRVAPAPRPPTAEEVRRSMVEAMAADNVRKGQARIKSTMTMAQQRQAQKEANEAMKTIVPENSLEKMNLCDQMNKYKAKFIGKIVYKWAKTPYEPDDYDVATLRSMVLQVQILLNSVMVPEMMKSTIAQVVDLAETLSMSQTMFPGLSLAGFRAAYDMQVENHVYDDEVDELAIKYGHLFRRPPEVRLGMKLLGTAAAVGTENWKQKTSSQILNNGGNKLRASLQRNADL